MKTPTIWVDLINPSDVHFFASLATELTPQYALLITSRSRDRSEVPGLADLLGLQNICIGKDYSNPIAKRLSLLLRLVALSLRVPGFEAALSFGNFMSILAAKVRRRPSILYIDNDLALSDTSLLSERVYKWVETRADFTVLPSAFAIQKLIAIGAREEKLFAYDGYKEQVYIADYQPDPAFLDNLPFQDYVLVRPEASFAAYVKERASLVPGLLHRLKVEGFNVVYLPRVAHDAEYARGLDVFIPEQVLRGLDLCWYSRAVLTGSGTFAREAACMGATAVSFFPGSRLLSVDQALADEGKLFHSRDVDEIVRYVALNHKRPSTTDLERAREVKAQVVEITREILRQSCER